MFLDGSVRSTRTISCLPPRQLREPPRVLADVGRAGPGAQFLRVNPERVHRHLRHPAAVGDLARARAACG